MKVLSGSSTTKIVANTMAMVVKSRPMVPPSLRARADATWTGPRAGTTRHTLAVMFGTNAVEALVLLVLVLLPLAVIVALVVAIVRLRARVDHLERQRPVGAGDLDALRADIGQALRHVAVVRYDAFGDMGGRLSLQCRHRRRPRRRDRAVLDPRARRVPHLCQGHRRGGSDATLTPEEQQALECSADRQAADRRSTTRYGYLGPGALHPDGAPRVGGVPRGRAGAVRLGRLRARGVAGRRDRRRDGADRELRRGRRVGDARRAGLGRAARRRSARCYVPITFVLAARAGMPLADVRTVGTHSHAWAQVRGWMDANLPGAVYVPTLSTAAAAAGSVAGGRAGFDAAVCAPVAAANQGLEVLAERHRGQRRRRDPVRPRGPPGRRCPSGPVPTRRPSCSSSGTTTPAGCSSCSSSSRCAAST